MNILITGAFGFVGTNLSKTLKTELNYHLIAIDIQKMEHHFFDEYFSWNDLEQIDWAKIDVIIHLAGKAHDTKNTTDEKAYFDINVGLTQKIFEYFLQSNASKFIFFSSVKAVADSVNGDCLTEAEIPSPKTPYGKSKLEAEKYIQNQLKAFAASQLNSLESDKNKTLSAEHEKSRSALRMTDSGKVPETSSGRRSNKISWLERHAEFISASAPSSPHSAQNIESNFGMTADKKVYILRPSMIHGPGNKGNLNLLYKLVQKGIPWPLGKFENKRSFTSIDNLAFVVQQFIEKDIAPGIYQISDDEPLSTNRIIELIAASKSRKARIWLINNKAIMQLAKLGDILHLPLNSERLKKLTESYVVSNKKIKAALNIERMPNSAEAGMEKTLNSFKKILS